MNTKWKWTSGKFLLVSIPVLVVLVPFLFFLAHNLFDNRLSGTIENSSKTTTHNVTLQWPQGTRQFTLPPGQVMKFRIKGPGEGALSLHVHGSEKTHTLLGYFTSRPFGRVQVVLDSKDLLRSHSWTRNLITDKPAIQDCDPTSCILKPSGNPD